MEGIRILWNYLLNYITNKEQDAITQPQCLVSDATAMVLYVSRAAGIAPLRFRRHRDGWLISVSPSAFVYSIILTLIIVATGIGGVVLDFSVDPSRSLRVRTPTKRILWIADFSVVMLTMLVAAFGGPLRMNNMIRYLNQTNKIKMSINNIQPVTSKRRKHIVLALMSMVTFASLLAAEYYIFVNQAKHFQRDLLIVYFYISYMGAYFALILLEMQFIFGVIMVYTAVEALNEPLTNLLEIADCKQNCITIIQKPKRHCETVRHLAVSYIKLCLVVREANRCHAITVLMMFCSNLTHLVITPYYLLLTLFSARNHPGMVLLELAWCLAHIISLLMLVEPCHWTQDEASHTQTLVSRLSARLAATDASLATELTKFFKHLVLNKIIYSPLGICQLTRSLCASIMGTLTTYLVILLQFQSIDEKKDGLI